MLRHLSLLPLHTNKPQPANNEFYSSFKHSYCSEKRLVDTNLHPRENYQCKIFGEYDFFLLNWMIWRASWPSEMSQGWFTEPLWFAPWAMVLVFLGCACEPGSLWGLGYFPNSFFPPLFFSSPLTDKQAEEGSEKPVLLKRPVFVLVSGICLYFTLTIANLEFNARRKRQSPDLLIYMFLTYLPLKSVVGGRETPEKDRLNWQIHLGVKIFKKKKKDLGHIL